MSPFDIGRQSAEVDGKAHSIIRLLQYACLVFGLLILAEIVIGTWRSGPPPMPLDTHGHTAAGSESPTWGS